MKRKITLLLFAASSALTVSSQVMIDEHFNVPFTPASAGWYVQNNSVPLGTQSWQQGNSGSYSAYDGSANAYFSANFNSQGATAGGISNWFITPTVTIYNGAVLQFATRSINGDANILMAPDRMQVRMSTSGSASVIPTGTASTGAFSTLLLDINPALNTNTAVTAITNGTMVNGYPNAWTVYTLQISGVSGTQTGRFAFRYFVDDAGANGANGNNIGVDAVKYTLPCGPTVESFTICANQAATLTATGGLPATGYLWTNSANTTTYNTSSIVVNSGAATTVYSLMPTNGTAPCGVTITSTLTIGSVMSINVSSSSPTLCSGSTLTLTASDAANTYSWSTGSTAPTITVAPTYTGTGTSTITYSVGASLPGTPLPCVGGNTISVIVKPVPTLTVSYDPASNFCSGGDFTVTASGANTYGYIFSSFSATDNPLAVTLGTTSTQATGQYIVVGTGTNGCSAAGLVTYTVDPAPTISVSTSNTLACKGSTITLTADGADTYSWAGAATSTNNPLSFATGTASGNRTFTVTGTTAAGCTNSVVFTQVVSPCLGIETHDGSAEAAIFPNPFNNELRISGLSAGNVEVYNALGQMVIKTTVKESEVVNTTDLVKGVYIVKAYNTDGQLTKTVKVIKN